MFLQCYATPLYAENTLFETTRCDSADVKDNHGIEVSHFLFNN